MGVLCLTLSPCNADTCRTLWSREVMTKKANTNYSQIPSTDIKIGVWQSALSSIYSTTLKMGPILRSKLSDDKLRPNQKLTFKNCACINTKGEKTILCSSVLDIFPNSNTRIFKVFSRNSNLENIFFSIWIELWCIPRICYS